MKKIITLLGSVLLLTIGCERRQLGGCFDDSYALIPVKIDWSQSGFTDENASKDPDDYVHRVSLRFFPKEGGEAFDRYLEGNITEGKIMVPVGEYSVIVFNESVEDQSWSDRISFTDINDYNRFAANKVLNKEPQSYFNISQSEPLVIEPPRLASWALDEFVVSREMATKTRTRQTLKPTPALDEMLYRLTHIVMYPLTYDVNVLLPVDNLKYAQQIMGHKRGFSRKVYMGSRKTEDQASSFLFKFNGRKWTDADKTHGTTEWTFRSFHTLPDPSSKHFVDLHIIMTTGAQHIPEIPFRFDVTDQVKTHASKAPVNRINIVLPSISLPKTEGGVNVGDWDDEDIIIK